MTELQEPPFVDLTDEDRQGGACPLCGARARLMSCWQCCEAAWVVACGHRTGAPPMQRGRSDGSDAERVFCSECAEAAVEPTERD